MTNGDGFSPWQNFFDNIWLLLVLGIVIPTVVYTAWGIWEVFQVKNLPLW